MNRLKDSDFKTIMLNLLKDIPDYLIEELQHAVQLKDKTTLMQILVSIIEDELNKLVELYGKQVGRQLSEDIETATQGEFRQILLCAIKNVRLPTPIIINSFGEEKQVFIDENKNYSIKEAQLLNGYLSKQPIDKNSITETFCEVDYFDLDEIDTEYKRKYGESLEDAIRKKTSGYYQETLLAMISSGRKRARLTAKWIHDALFSSPVNKRHLTRLLITRSEIDLYTVMIVYQELYRTSLESDIKKKTEGLYKKTLLTLLGLNKKCPFTPN
ncbi:unnamed protein product [Trichobilharzia szidati]|nr:unnamed protein product [Trichobilharzia szidati]